MSGDASANAGQCDMLWELEADAGDSEPELFRDENAVSRIQFTGGSFARAGFSDEALWERNPRLVIAHISGFGQTGVPEYVNRASYDPIAQAFGCAMRMNGMEGLPSTKKKLSRTNNPFTPLSFHAIGKSAGRWSADFL